MEAKTVPATEQYFAAIEGGGTKFNCAIIDAQRNIHAQCRIPTTTPDETLNAVCDFFIVQQQQGFHFHHLGLACFGPLELNPASTDYGKISITPKPHWSHYPLLDHLSTALDCKVALDTDVNGAAMAEFRWGAAKNTQVCVYVTIGTGVGGGVLVNGQPLHGLIHPEIGHMLIPAPTGIQGVCPFHGNCIEGLASGTAMAKIWQQPAETLGDQHQAWDIQAQIIATLCHNLLVAFSAQKIVLGGGVMNKPGLLENVIKHTSASLNHYLTLPAGTQIGDILVLPELGEQSGLMGALALAMDAAVA